MIHESQPWREALKKDAQVLNRWASRTRASERRAFIIERKIFLTAYAIRKLIESEKLSSSTENEGIHCIAFRALPGAKQLMERQKFEESYDFENKTHETLTLIKLTHLIIHSSILVECVDERMRMSGFLVTTKQKISSLFQIPLNEYMRAIELVADDDPSTSQWAFDPETQETLKWRGHGVPPRKILDKFSAIREKYSTPGDE
tara:strand:+ start:123 stop:731 length:609 start_codon:yes stop_codon:yes gene_type:complete